MQLNETAKAQLRDAGLLVMRVAVGGMMAAGHGYGKFVNLLTQRPIEFGDPIGIGVAPSLALAASAEFLCAIAIVLGLFTRLATIPLMITMLVAAGIVHAEDLWPKKEFALLYFVPFLTLALTGAGRYSLDALIWKKK